MSPGQLSAKRRGDYEQTECHARAVWEKTCVQLERAGRPYFETAAFYRAILAIEKHCLRKNRVPMRAEYRDRMLAALAQVDCALFKYRPSFWDAAFPSVDFEALSALIMFWAEAPEATAKRSVERVQDARARAAAFRGAIQNLQREERDDAQLIREYHRQKKITGEAA